MPVPPLEINPQLHVNHLHLTVFVPNSNEENLRVAEH